MELSLCNVGEDRLRQCHLLYSKVNNFVSRIIMWKIKHTMLHKHSLKLNRGLKVGHNLKQDRQKKTKNKVQSMLRAIHPSWKITSSFNTWTLLRSRKRWTKAPWELTSIKCRKHINYESGDKISLSSSPTPWNTWIMGNCKLPCFLNRSKIGATFLVFSMVWVILTD